MYGIVKQHGGHIAVDTRVGEGTTFRLYWPALSVAQPHVEDEVPFDLARGHGETILVVEDNVTIRTALVEVLDMQGYHVLEATNGKEALEVCAHSMGGASADSEQSIALVLSDWVMPVMSGLELVRELARCYKMIKVVLLTGYPLTEEVKNNVPKNVVGWLLKPPSLEQLTEVVARALGKSARVSH